MLTTIVLLWMARELQAPLWIWIILWMALAYNILVLVHTGATALRDHMERRAKEQYEERIKDLYPHRGDDE